MVIHQHNGKSLHTAFLQADLTSLKGVEGLAQGDH
jgi:hypothetical protein